MKITQTNVDNDISFSSQEYGSEKNDDVLNMENFYTQIGKLKAVVIPTGQYLTLSQELPAPQFKIIETPVRQIHKRIAKHLEEKLALLNPV